MGNQHNYQENELYYSPISPKIYFEPSFELSRPIGNETFHKQKNFGFLPLGVVHNLLLFLEPKEFCKCLCTCKIVCEIGRTNRFWKDYYFCFFHDKKSPKFKNKEEEVEDEENVNWKVRFYEQYSFLSDDFYRYFLNFEQSRKRVRVPSHFKYVTKRKSHKYEFLIIGPEGSGKEDFVLNLVQEIRSYTPNKVQRGFEGSEVFDVQVKRGLGILYRQDFVDVHVRLRNYVSPLEESEFTQLRLNPKFWGIFLCFSVHDRKSFERMMKMYSKVLKDNSPGLNKSTVCLIVGLNKKKIMHNNNNNDEEDEKETEGEEEEQPKKVRINEIERFIITNELLGYVECDILSPFTTIDEEKGEQDSDDSDTESDTELSPQNNVIVPEVKNVILSFGLLIDSVIRRGNSIASIQMRLETGEIDEESLKEKYVKERKKKKHLMLHNRKK